ncbi:hypothetical protein KKG36_00800 [Patescibacteria group bacterium]|nr:hypothetical protein [Patescibacteria group bacterium]
MPMIISHHKKGKFRAISTKRLKTRTADTIIVKDFFLARRATINGIRTMIKKPKELPLPTVFKRFKGNKPKICKTANNNANTPETARRIKDQITSFLEKIFTNKKKKTQSPVIVIKLWETFCGHPQKLPYLETEKIVENKELTSKAPITIFILLKLKLKPLSNKALAIQANKERKTKTNKTACLLKSSKFEVAGAKKTGRRKIREYRLYFDMKLQTLTAEDDSFGIFFKM